MEEEKSESKVRIFVGGLGSAVNSDELRRMFELSGGDVESLDFVRSKNRSFAYVDFSPSSEKSLPKLFAKYNGCVWKGGKLKLEKAKEHYLKRLAREWDEESSANEIALPRNQDSSEIPQNLIPPEKRDVRIFFPRLRKVKVLPFNGTGKHKYSFQRIDVSLRPKYFCDCEEHSGSAEQEKQVCHVEAESCGVNQEELNIMNKVMNTLFQNQTYDSGTSHTDNAENKADDDDEDLVINFVSKGSDKVNSSGRQQILQVSQNQLKRGTQEERSKRGPYQGNDSEPQNKKMKPLSLEQKSRDVFNPLTSASKGDLYTNPDKSCKLMVEVKRVEPEPTKPQSNSRVSRSQKSSWKKLFGDKSNNTFSLASTEEGEPILDHPNESHTDSREIVALTEKNEPISDVSNVPDADSKNENLVKLGEFVGTEMETEESPAKPNVVSSQPRQGALWMQKSSWTQLIGENGLFCISQPKPCTTLGHHQVPEKPKDVDTPSSIDGKFKEIENSSSNGPIVSRTEEDISGTLKDNEQAILGNKESSTSVLEDNGNEEIMRIAPVRVEVSETCTFMRSAASLKEWAKTKTALRGSQKRKSNQK